MNIHHLNCGTLCLGTSKSHLTCHCVLIETVNRIKHLGYTASDVRHIILTHLDFDHAGGIDDFPESTIHLLAAEKQAALKAAGWLAHRRYSVRQFQSHDAWQTYSITQGDSWFGFDAVKQLQGLPPEILLVPLVGHTLGHAGVALQTSEGWLLHSGDAYFYHGEMDPTKPRCTSGLRFYQWMMDSDHKLRRRNQERLRALVRNHGNEVRVFSAHDPQEYKALVREQRTFIEPVQKSA